MTRQTSQNNVSGMASFSNPFHEQQEMVTTLATSLSNRSVPTEAPLSEPMRGDGIEEKENPASDVTEGAAFEVEKEATRVSAKKRVPSVGREEDPSETCQLRKRSCLATHYCNP